MRRADQASCGSRRSCGARVTTSPASTLSTVPSASAISARLTGSTQPRRAAATSAADRDRSSGSRHENPTSEATRAGKRTLSPSTTTGPALRLDDVDLDVRAAAHPDRLGVPGHGLPAVRSERRQAVVGERSRNTSTWCAIALVMPHAAVPGVPEVLHARHPRERQAGDVELRAREPHLLVHARRLESRCGSPAIRGRPDTVRDPCTAHPFEPEPTGRLGGVRGPDGVGAAHRQSHVRVPQQRGNVENRTCWTSMTASGVHGSQRPGPTGEAANSGASVAPAPSPERTPAASARSRRRVSGAHLGEGAPGERRRGPPSARSASPGDAVRADRLGEGALAPAPLDLVLPGTVESGDPARR